MPALEERAPGLSPDDDVAERPPEVDPRAGDVAIERALAVLVAGVAAWLAAVPIRDNSLLTHIATGRLQVSEGLPTTNPFLVSSTDFPVPSWWWSAALGRAEQLLGLGGIRLLTAAVAAALGVLLVRVCRPATRPDVAPAGPLVAGVPVFAALLVLTPFLNGRPHLAGFVLLAATLVVWHERRSPWWLVGVGVLWVNVHGTWLQGLVVLGVLWAATALDRRTWQLDRLRWPAALAAGVLLGGVFYPERFRLVLLPTEQIGDETARQALATYVEWRSAGVGSGMTWAVVALMILAVWGALRRREWGALGAAVVLGVTGLMALRALPTAAIALGSLAAVGMSELVRPVGMARWLRLAALWLGAVLLVAAGWRALDAPHLDLGLYPTDEVAWLEERGLVANPDVRLVTNDWVGNYLEFTYGADANAWIDDRSSAATLLDYVAMRQMDPGWEDAFSRSGAEVVLWQSKDPLPEELAGWDDWTTALTTDRFHVLCHATIAPRCR